MAIYLWRYCRVNKKKLLSISFYKDGREIETVIFKPSQSSLTIGQTLYDDLNITLPGIPHSYKLVNAKRGGHNLLVPPNLEGDITIGPNTLPLKGLIDFGLLRREGKNFLFQIPKDVPCLLRIGDTTLSFSYKEVVVAEKKKKKIDPSLKKSLISRENYAFLFILLISAAINFSVAVYLNTIEIKKVEHTEVLKNIPQRFAKLILKPKESRPIKSAAKLKPEEKETPQKTEEQKKKEESKDSAKGQRQSTASSGKTGDGSGSGVGSKGLLGLITAKTKPSFLSDALFEADDAPASGGSVSALGGRGLGGSGAGGAGGTREVLAGLSVKGIDKVELDSMASTGASYSKKTKDAAEILKEKREVSLEGAEKKKVSEKGIARKRDEGDVSRTVHSYVGGVKYLYNNALRRDSTLKGKITVRVVISSDGKVTKVEKVVSTLNSPELEEAIINRVYKWLFSAATGADDFEISYTFDFSPTT